VKDSFAGHTLETARRMLTARFRKHAIGSAELDARILVGAVLGLDLTGLIKAANRLLTVEEANRLEHYAGRRLNHEPVARLVGFKEFWGLQLELCAATLVPRADTETVVELALEMVPAVPPQARQRRIADIGTGSGAILLALSSELRDAYAVGTDISMAALQIARGNAAALGMRERTGFVACNYAAALSKPFDLIVSNPPYIRSAEIRDLAPEVRNHDPHRALDGGTDGLDAYRALIPQAAALLAPQGALVLEVGYDQSGQIEALMAAEELTFDKRAKTDLGGIRRAVAGRKKPS
jgi:release factor glutamine methyltransferase